MSWIRFSTAMKQDLVLPSKTLACAFEKRVDGRKKLRIILQSMPVRTLQVKLSCLYFLLVKLPD